MELAPAFIRRCWRDIGTATWGNCLNPLSHDRVNPLRIPAYQFELKREPIASMS